jgi:hypothetical protein
MQCGKQPSSDGRVDRPIAPHAAQRHCPASGAAQTQTTNNKAANTMNTKHVRTRRFNASHVVEAELDHLDWATKQPTQRMLDAGYWRRRLLAVKCRFELSEQQVARVEKILQRLGPLQK